MSSSTAVSAAREGVAAPGTPRRPRGPRTHSSTNRRTTIAWLLTPAGIIIVALVVVPIAFLVFTSFTDYDQRSLFTGEFSFTSLQQYGQMFADPDFWWAIVRTLLFTAAMVGGSVFAGMAVSQMLAKLGSVMRYVVTVALILAWAVPNVASSQIWNWLFQPGYGVMNWLLTQLHVFGDMTNTNWSQNAFLAYLMIWLLIVWQAVPFIALTLYAAQSQVDPAYFEAARLDGASEWRIYWTVTLNFLKPTLLLMTVLSIIWDFNVFNQIWLISAGGPNNATATLGVWAYKVAFVGHSLGYGAAISVVAAFMLMGISAFYIRSLVRSGEDL